MEINKIHISDIIGGRYDSSFTIYKRKINSYKFPVSKLGDLLLVKPQYGANEAGVDRVDEKTPRYIRITDIDEYGQLNSGFGVTANTIDSKYILNNDDILIARSGNTVGKSYIHKITSVKYDCFFAGYMIRFVVNQKLIIPDYLFTITQISFYKEWLKAIQRTTGQPNVNAEEYKSLPIPLPSIEKQREIIELHNKAQSEKQEKEQQAKELIEGIDIFLLDQLNILLPEKQERQLPSKVNISEMLGNRYDPYYHQQYFKDAFEALDESNYPICCLGKIALKITSGITPLSGGDAYTNSNDGIPFIRSGNIDINGNLNFNELLYLKPHVHEIKMKSSQVQNGDLMIAIVGATIGQVGIYTDSREANINQAIALVRLNAGVNKQFMKEQIKSGIGQLNLNRLKRPVARANINLEEISTMKLIIPPLAKQNEIAETISRIRGKASAMQAEALAQFTAAKQQIERIILG